MSYNLTRFIAAHKIDYGIALTEIKAGQKITHWMWYIFPQIKGLGKSLLAEKYAIQDIEEAKAYIKNKYLKRHLIQISKELLKWKDTPILEILGTPDDLKLCSCMTLFEYVAPDIPEFAQVLEVFYEGKRDAHTLKILNNMQNKNSVSE